MKKFVLISAACLTIAGLSACTTPQQTVGTTTGAVTGAVVGGPVGAVVGGVAGAAIGDSASRPRGSDVVVVPGQPACATSTTTTQNAYGDTRTVQRTDC